jgi:hypothetical protein
MERRRNSAASSDALRALSSLVEADPGDLDLIRGVASTALALGQPEAACELYLRAIRARPHEPVPWLGLAAGAGAAGMGDLAMIYHAAAFAARWSDDGEYLRRIQAYQYYRLLERIVALEVPCFRRDFAKSRLEVLRPSSGWFRGGLVVLLTWNTDRTDLDLHVVDPEGNRCYYGEPGTPIGGQLSRDILTGYGPEMFWLRKPVPGRYVVQVGTFATNDQRTSERIEAMVTITTHWGTPEETVRTISVPLQTAGARTTVAPIDIE